MSGVTEASSWRLRDTRIMGCPFGQDRIVPIFLATLAVRQQSQTIRFRTAAEMFETFGMHKGGKEYLRLIAAFERIFGATIFFGTDGFGLKARVVQRSRFSFFSEAQIWHSRDPDRCPLSDQFENVIVLSDEFYRKITAHPIPADLEAVKVLAGAPAVNLAISHAQRGCDVLLVDGDEQRTARASTQLRADMLGAPGYASVSLRGA